MTPTPPDAASSTPGGTGLIFDWKHRPRTWPRLSFWLLLVLSAHVAGFVVFRVRTPAPARAMPVPASVVLAPAHTPEAALSGGHASLTGQLSPSESADLDLPEQAPVDPHVPAFANHSIARQPWPPRPERPAWPEVSGVSQPVLPPAAPAPPSEDPAAPPR